ncbi:N-glycosylase/DNA lyase [Naviculisporaceae sp. PSN 640]
MAAQRVAGWRKLPLSLTELCIDTTLKCGQSFRWHHINNEWHCVLQGRIISLKQDPSHLYFKATWPEVSSLAPATPPVSIKSESPLPVGTEDDDGTASLLHSYFALSHSLTALYKQWAASDANFARRAPAFTGIRILNQDAWETLISFICSSNNNISRISQMVHKLCIHYGPYIGTIHGHKFHDFPRPDALTGGGVEAHLRELGFGYRAKYIAETARIVAAERPADWLDILRNPACPAYDAPDRQQQDEKKLTPAAIDSKSKPTTYKSAHEALLELSGVGPKVADCVCLMGLGWGESVPIDTHVWQIAQRDYKFGKGGGANNKTLSKAMYDAVGDYFREIWGPHAGWAQSVLFTANLKSFAAQASSGGKKGTVVTETKTDIETAVKVEETKEGLGSTNVSSFARTKTKKRKTVVKEEVAKTEDIKIEVTEVETSGLRRSKRRKAGGS